MEELAGCILKRCRGHPLAICTIGGLLAGWPKTNMEWMKLHQHLGPELESDFGSIMKVIVSSYNRMPYKLKSIFLYLSIFPENHEIRRSRLLRRWMAEGYVANYMPIPREEVAERCYYEFVKRGMLQPIKKIIPGVEVNHCQIHSLLLHIIIREAVEEMQLCFIDKQWNDAPQSKIRHLVVSRWKSEENLANIDFSHTRSLTVFEDCPNSLISPKMRVLRVLDLEDTTSLKNEDLRHIGELHHLRYLSLRGTNISKLPSSLQNLRFLETLDIKNTKVKQLPHGIFKLEKLHYLLVGVKFSRDILQKVTQSEVDNQKTNLLGIMASFLCSNRSDNCSMCNIDQLGVWAPKGIERLRKLQMLGLVNVGQGNGVAGSLEKLTNLQKLGVTVTGFSDEEGQTICQSIGKLSELQKLEVRSRSLEFLANMDESATPKHLASLKLLGDLFKLPNWFTLLNVLTTVKLLGTKLEQGQVNILGNLRSVASLCLWEKSYKGESLLISNGEFPMLKFLYIDGLENIEMVTIEKPKLNFLDNVCQDKIEIKVHAVPALEKLWVKNCKALRDNSDGLSGVQYLENLNELLVKQCGEKDNLIQILQWQVSQHEKRPKFLIGKIIVPISSQPSTSAAAII